jgi:multidrug transporter EmrE-like cation transporter
VGYLFLAASILFEVLSSTMLKLSNGFKHIIPIVVLVAGYGVSFYALSKTLQVLPLGIVYATWSGVGTILTVIIGVLLFKERINKKGILGIAVLLAGLVLMNLSK